MFFRECWSNDDLVVSRFFIVGVVRIFVLGVSREAGICSYFIRVVLLLSD